jgi:hypothetical protein
MTSRIQSTILIIALLAPVVLYAQDRHKTVRVLGLRVFSESRLIGELGLDRLPAGRPAFEEAASTIDSFYHEKGYLIARAYLVRETDDELTVFVDEGRIDKVLFLNLNTVNILRMRYEFRLKNDIYNLYEVEKTLGSLRTRFNFKSTGAKLIPVRNYDKSFFQIDRGFTIPLAGEQKLPFFENYRPRYDLNVYIQRYSAEETRGVTYGVKTSYSKGLRPWVKYTHPSLLGEKDRFELGVSAGIFYGLDLELGEPPRWTYMELSADYLLPPVFEKYFTPAAKGYAYRSWASRSDLGLAQYEYLILRGTLAPGITFLNRYRAFAGYGIERVFIYDSEIDPEAGFIADISSRVDNWGFFELGVRADLFPFSIRHLIERNFSLTWNYYMNDTEFYKLRFDGTMGFEFSNFDIFSLGMDAVWFWQAPPFYYEESVDSATFKGFMGKSYHAKKVGRLSAEYRVSVYRDYVFTGIFSDGAVFFGSGYDLTGWQRGAVAGLSGHVIFLDQFEFNIYYGKDYLFSSGESQYNIYLSLEKKW